VDAKKRIGTAASEPLQAASKKSVLIKDATHFVLFEKPRFEFFNEIQTFLKE
jgi:alpha-beta hydrolase superfamily lysophospholipase